MALPLSLWLGLVFLLGAAFGGLIHSCVERLPFERSLLWPGPRCPRCAGRVSWLRLLPLVGGTLVARHCPACGAPAPGRRLFLEVLTGLAFAGLFYLEVVTNIHGLDLLGRRAADIARGDIPWQAWVVFGHHALLVSFLLTASFSDLDHKEIPLSLTLTGTVLGLLLAAAFAWPWPGMAAAAPPRRFGGPLTDLVLPDTGLYPWPLWYPLPAALRPGGNWQTGLATGLAGALAGTFLLRTVRTVFGLGRGKEGLGIGDADLMMMAGSFLGWQVVVIAFFVSVFPALIIGVTQLVLRGDQELPFGPSLSLGLILTMLGWSWVGPRLAPLFFDGLLMSILGGAAVGFLFLASVLLRLLRGPDDQGPVETGKSGGPGAVAR